MKTESKIESLKELIADAKAAISDPALAGIYKTEIKGHIAKAEKQIEKLTWESKTRRGEIVRVMKNLNEGGRFKWVVKSGKLYEESFFSTKKTAVKWAKEIIETYNKARTA